MAQTESTAKLVILTELRDQASDAMRRMGDVAGDLGGQLGFASDKSGILASGLAAIGGSVVINSIKAFNQSQETLDKARGIFEALPDGINKYNQALAVASQAQQKFGFDGEDATLAIARFANATGGNMTLALQAFQAAMGLSVDRNQDLNSSVAQLLPTFAGGGRAVKALGIDIDEHANAQTAFQAVIKATSGELKAYGESATTAGKVFKQNLQDTMENMGEPLAFVTNGLMKGANQILAVGNASQAAKPFIEGLGIAIAAVSTYIAVINAPAMLTKLLTSLGLLAAGAEVTLGSIAATVAVFAGWVLVIAAVVGAIIWMVQNWDTVKEKVREVWEFLSQFISDHWRTILQILMPGLGSLVVFFVDNWGKISDGVKLVWDTITKNVKEAFTGVYTFISTTLGAIGTIWQTAWGAIGTFFASVWQGMVGAFKGAINNIISGINSFINGFNSIKINVPEVKVGNFTVGGFSIGVPQIPNIPMLANGGIVNKATLAIIGENGPEAVVPLSKGGFGMGGGGITVVLQGDFYTDSEVAERFGNQLAFVIKNQLNLSGIRA